ncbi:MAG: MarR family winged helix-turn-helix transcriptional regulator [Planctomycetota bacterium]
MPAKTPIDVKTIDGLIKSLLVLARTVNHVLETRAVESAVGEQLSPSKVQILRLLGERGRQNSSRVAYFLGVSKPAVSQIIDAMSRDGLVSRETALHDRREGCPGGPGLQGLLPPVWRPRG